VSTRYQGEAIRRPGESCAQSGSAPAEAAGRRRKKPRTLGSALQIGLPGEAPRRPLKVLYLIAVALMVVGAALMAEALR
jgi:hypothetical protein